jgi:hypothetical protein
LKVAVALLLIASATRIASAADPLPSWNDTPTKQAIIAFVEKVTKEGGPDFVPVDERIATFDNDGTLWSEKPLYFQLVFALDRVKALVEKHPKLKDEEPYQSVLAGETKHLVKAGEKAFDDMIMKTHAGMTVEEFAALVEKWLKTAKHPRFNRPYTDLIYQPMLELLAYLRSKGFKTFVVSGGGIEFMRVWTQKAYGIPPWQIVGSSNRIKYELRDGQPVLMRLPEINFIDDGPGKPVGIETHIGMRPIMAFGNSDGDYEMLRYTMAGKGPRFGLIVHHTDAVREWAYDRDSDVGRLVRGLDDAPRYGWLIMDMKKDWKMIYPFEK